MAIQDIRSDLSNSAALIATVTGNGTTNGAIIDTAEMDGGLMFSVSAPVYTDGTYTFTLQEGDESNLSDAATVASGKLLGSLTDLTLSAATASGGDMADIGVFSNKRYVRLQVTAASVTTGATIVAVATQKNNLVPA